MLRRAGAMAGSGGVGTWYERAGGAVPQRPALAGRAEAATCIVGGGLAGLGVALSLAERGHGAVLLEAGRIGGGASGRNGGMVSAGFGRPLDFVARATGRGVAEQLYRLSLAAVALLRRRIGRHAIACHPVEGVVEASWHADAAATARRVAELNRLGARLEPWPGERLRAAYRSRHYRSGFLDPEGFHLDPLALCRGLAAAAAAMGVAIHEGSPARGLGRAGQGWRVTTAGGAVLAREVVLCTSADRPGLCPALARATLPVTSHIGVTAPLGERLALAIRAPYAVYDDRMATGYYRPLPGGRLLWGGGVDALGRRRPEAALRRDLARVFPQLAEVAFACAWSGAMGFVRHRMPVVRPLGPGLWVATGFGGHGLNTTTLAGELVATAIVEHDERWRLLDAFDLPWNGGPLGPLAAQGFYWAWRLRDALRPAMTRAGRVAASAV
jgi:gamma-glutamylputrescine oxidase